MSDYEPTEAEIETLMHDPLVFMNTSDPYVRRPLAVGILRRIHAARVAARKAERERCAKVAEEIPQTREWVRGSLYDMLRRDCAAAIRALPEEKTDAR